MDKRWESSFSSESFNFHVDTKASGLMRVRGFYGPYFGVRKFSIVFVFHFLLSFLLVCSGGEGGKEQANEDPANKLIRPAQLDFKTFELCQRLFAELESKDFDIRDDAMRRLASRGPSILKMVEEYANSANLTVAAQSRRLKGKILLEYDGFLPLSVSLNRTLKKIVTFKMSNKEDTVAGLRRLAKEQGVHLLFDQRIKPQAQLIRAVEFSGAVGDTFKMLAEISGVSLVPRGDLLLATSAQTAKKLSRQRKNFNWSHLGYDRKEAARIGEILKNFFPPVKTELHTGSAALSVRGASETIPKAARLIALLDARQPPTCWPKRLELKQSNAIIAMLKKTSSIRLSGDDLLFALQDFKKQGHVIKIRMGEKVFHLPDFPRELEELSPVHLTIGKIPLGLSLRWLMKRVEFIGEHANSKAIWFELNSGGEVVLRVGAKVRNLLGLSVGGVDVSFLIPEGRAKPTQAQDEAARTIIVNALRHQLALFPRFQIEKDLFVIRGRLVLQGSAPAISWVLSAMEKWKKIGHPDKSSWRSKIETSLNQEIDWNGRGLNGGKLLRRLGKVGSFPILLEDDPSGKSAHFRITPEQSELLAPGKYPLRKLLDELVKIIHARWYVKWGVVVIMPKQQD